MKKILLIIAIAFCIFQMVVLATAIDIGNPAIDRPNTTTSGGRTQVARENPSESDGTITSVEIWANSPLVNCTVATFFVVSGNNLSTRDDEFIGAVTAGSKQTFPVNLEVRAGDYIGFYCSDGTIEADYSAIVGRWWLIGDYIPCTNTTFNSQNNNTISLYGIGETAPPAGWDGPFNSVIISKWNTKEITKWNTIE